MTAAFDAMQTFKKDINFMIQELRRPKVCRVLKMEINKERSSLTACSFTLVLNRGSWEPFSS